MQRPRDVCLSQPGRDARFAKVRPVLGNLPSCDKQGFINSGQSVRHALIIRDRGLSLRYGRLAVTQRLQRPRCS